jgi:hypothetical protein
VYSKKAPAGSISAHMTTRPKMRIGGRLAQDAPPFFMKLRPISWR